MSDTNCKKQNSKGKVFQESWFEDPVLRVFLEKCDDVTKARQVEIILVFCIFFYYSTSNIIVMIITNFCIFLLQM